MKHRVPNQSDYGRTALMEGEGAFMDAASVADRDHYRDQMVALCGDNRLPAVRYKGAVYPQRAL